MRPSLALVEEGLIIGGRLEHFGLGAINSLEVRGFHQICKECIVLVSRLFELRIENLGIVAKVVLADIAAYADAPSHDIDLFMLERGFLQQNTAHKPERTVGHE